MGGNIWGIKVIVLSTVIVGFHVIEICLNFTHKLFYLKILELK